MRRLIFNADDFGFTSGVNRAIAEAHARGIVTSATAMANGPAFAEIIQLARSVPKLSVGCHVVLVDGIPALPPANIPSLLADKDSTCFRPSLGQFAFKALTGGIDEKEIEAEATAQIRKLQVAGISVFHFDTHKHAHMFPRVLRPLLCAAQACGVSALRNPFEPLRFAHLTARPGLWKRWAEVKMLHTFAAQFKRAVASAGLLTTDGTVGIWATGALDESLFQFIVENLPEGTWEFVCHPGYNDAQLQAARTKLLASREKELQVLTSTAAREILARNGVELISYRDLT